MSDPLALLGIGAKAWAELAQIEQDGLRRRNLDSSGMPITWGTFRLVMEVLRDRQSAQAGPGVASEDVQADLDAFQVWRAHGKGGAPSPQACVEVPLATFAEVDQETRRWFEQGGIYVRLKKHPSCAWYSGNGEALRYCAKKLRGLLGLPDLLDPPVAALDRAVALPEEK